MPNGKKVKNEVVVNVFEMDFVVSNIVFYSLDFCYD